MTDHNAADDFAGRLPAERIGGLLMLTFSIAYGALCFNIPVLTHQLDVFNARSLPMALAVTGTLLSLSMILRGGGGARGLGALRWPLGVAFLLLMSGYGLVLRPVGFIAATAAFLATGFVLLGERRVGLIAGIGLLVAVGFWLLMTQLLGVWIEPLPTLAGRQGHA